MPTDHEIGLELLTILPHTVNASIFTDNTDRVWSSLRDEFMVTPAAELVLTHGVSPPGEWAMLGILSARPDIGEMELQQRIAALGSDLPIGLVNSGVGQMAQILAPIVRGVLGRPSASYALTPLLIFREIT